MVDGRGLVVTAPTTRGVATVLRAAGHRSYATDKQSRCPATGYHVRTGRDGSVVVWYRTDRVGGDPRSDETLRSWAAALARWDVTREGTELIVRERGAEVSRG